MKTILQNRKTLMWVVLVLAVSVIIYFGYAGFAEGFKDGYQHRGE